MNNQEGHVNNFRSWLSNTGLQGHLNLSRSMSSGQCSM